MFIKQSNVRSNPKTSLMSVVSAAFLLQIPVASHAQEFADDFSINSIRYSTGTFNDSTGASSTTAIPGAIKLSADSDGTGSTARFLSVQESSDTFEITGNFDTDTLQLSDGAWAQISAQGALFNDTFDNTAGSEVGDGNVFVSVNSTVFSDNLTNLFVCLGRDSVGEVIDYLLFENGTNSCKDYSLPSLQPGDDLKLGFSLDRDAKTLTIVANEVTDIFDIPTDIFPTNDNWRAAVLSQEQGQGSASFNVTGTKDSFVTDEFGSIPPAFDRYRLSYRTEQEKPVWLDERLVVSYTGSDDTGAGRLDLLNPTDYTEATIEISGTSDIGYPDASVGGRLEKNLYNDIADGGVDRYLGNVRANVQLDLRNDGLRRAEYCIYRLDDANGNESTGLLDENGSSCAEFPLQIAFDQKYRMSIELDRLAAEIVIQVNGHKATIPVSTPIFQQFNQYANVEINANSNSSVVGYIDDIRTAPFIATGEEIAAGLDIAPSFPAAPELIVVDSTLDLPYDFNQPLDFVDDFSTNTLLLGFEQYPASTESSISHNNGAIELQTHSNREPEDGSSNTNFLITQPTDSIRILASLSGRSAVPPGDRSEASLQLNAVFHNDTVDGGAGERTGDIRAELRISLEGSGRRVIEAQVRRRDSNGDNNRLEIFPDGENNYRFNGLVPEFDRPYDLQIRLDRENRAMVFSVDAMEIAAPLNTELFAPAQRRIDINSTHNGTSGRSVVRIHAIETDSDLLDFSTNPPVLAPYRPTFSDRFPGRATTVSDGRVRFFADGNVTSGRDPNIRINGSTDFVGATLELSSESVIAADGKVFVDVSGTMYNDIGDDLEGSEGNVFAALRLTATDSQRFVEYCAFRSTTSDFSDSVELIGGSEDCPRFEIQPEFDVAYPSSIMLNTDEATLTYRFADETQVYNIGTGIFSADESFTGTRARTSDGSVVVAYADDLSFSANPTPLIVSTANLSNLFFELAANPDSEVTNPDSELDTSQELLQFPDCSAAASDTDGDGWGWENEMSCIVAGSPASQAAALIVPPVCTDMVEVIDELGWGWENEATCIAEGSFAQALFNR